MFLEHPDDKIALTLVSLNLQCDTKLWKRKTIFRHFDICYKAKDTIYLKDNLVIVMGLCIHCKIAAFMFIGL